MIRMIRAFLVVLTLTFVGFTAAQALDSADLTNAIENAKTPADHEAIAGYFDEQAKEARAEASSHQRMGAVYKKQPASSLKSGGGHSFPTQMADHCADLVSKYEEAAKDYDAMAAGHRAQAKAAQ